MSGKFVNHVCETETGSNSGLPPLSKNASNRERFCRAFRKLTLVSSKNPLGRMYFRSNAAIAYERNRHIQSNLLHIIHPFSVFRSYWELWMMMLFLIGLIFNPLDAAFKFDTLPNIFDSTPALVATVLDVLCIIDIILTFFTGYGISSTKEVVLDPGKICRNYLTTYFFLDALSSVPYRAAQYIFNFHEHAPTIIYATALLKIYRMRTLMVYLKRAADMWEISLMLYLGIRYSLLVVLIIHWTACVHYTVPFLVASIFHTELDHNSWIVVTGLDRVDSTFDKYVHCIYKATSFLLNTSYGTFAPITTEDLIVGILTLLIGAVLSTLLVVLLLQIFSSASSAETKYQEIMNQVQEYMRYKQLPLNMQKRLISFYEYRFQKKYFREDAISANLSQRLRREINVYCYRRLVDTVSLFKDMPHHVVADIVNCLKSEIYLPNDIIVKAGTIGECMYFLASGTVCVVTPTGKEVCHLYDGDYFGEIALIMKDQKRIASVIAIEISEVYRLDKKNFKSCFATNTALYKHVDLIAQERRERTQILEDLHKKYLMAFELPRER